VAYEFDSTEFMHVKYSLSTYPQGGRGVGVSEQADKLKGRLRTSGVRKALPILYS